jgi:SAM-dependent methyltransferase
MTRRPPENYGPVAARCYDSLHGDHLSRIAAMLARQAVPARDMHDVGCGTGTLCRQFAQQGWTCSGMDLSGAMVEVARGRCRRATFSIGDAASYRLDRRVGLVTATCDVASHLPGIRALRGFLASSRSALLDGGLLAFDLLAWADLETNWDDYVQYTRRRDWRLIRYGRRLRPGVAALSYEYFMRGTSGDWSFHFERHVLRTWPLEDVRRTISECGFTDCSVLDGDTLGRVGRRTVRWLFLARNRRSGAVRFRRAARRSGA